MLMGVKGLHIRIKKWSELQYVGRESGHGACDLVPDLWIATHISDLFSISYRSGVELTDS